MISQVASRFRTGLWLGILASAACFPYAFHQSMGSWSDAISRDWGDKIDSGTVFLFQFSLTVAVILICAMIGAFLAERYKLPGLGSPLEAYLTAYRYGAPALLAALLIGWRLNDRFFYQVAPAYSDVSLYPHEILWCVALVFHNAIMREVVLCFGMLTLVAGLFRGKRPMIAVVITAVFTAVLSIRQLVFVGYPMLDHFVWFSIIWSFLLNMVVGTVYIKKGLWAAMSMRACLDARFVIYPLLGMI